jgi:hypothetical protein
VPCCALTGTTHTPTTVARAQVRANDPNAKAMQKALAALFVSLDVRLHGWCCCERSALLRLAG